MPPRSSRSNWSEPSRSPRAREGSPARFVARVEYAGTDFAGFQLQSNARTVQGELEAALARLNRGERVVVDGAGRTDAGVHATGQVIAFTYCADGPVVVLQRAINALLPSDVAIRGLRRAPARFHPRYAARYREYRYTVWNGPRSPLRERMALGLRAPLDVAAMASAGSVFVGRHDFSSFGNVGVGRSPIRTVHLVRVRREGRLVTIDVRAESFLRGQVRRMAAALIEVGRGRMNEAELAAALAAAEPALNGAAAPAKGLCLRRVVLGRRPANDKEDEE
jgi:tRNA pseudouridine38-40 synthase